MNRTTAELQEFCQISQGGRLRLSSSDFVSQGYPAFGAGGLNGFLPSYEFDRPAVVLSSIGARCGKCFYVEGKWTSLANTQVILPDPQRADTKYLWFQLNDERRWHRSGTGQPFIKPADVKRHRVLLPPLQEQRRIAKILDKAEGLRGKRRSALAQFEILKESIFFEMFGDPATNPNAWPIYRVGDIATVQGGLQVTRARANLPYEVPYLRVANVYRQRLELTEIKTIRATAAEITRTKLVKDDLLIVEGHGNPEEIGRGALWDGSVEGCVHQNHIIRVRFDLVKVVPLYASEYLNSPGGRRHLLRAGKTTSGLNTISVSEVRETPIALPPTERQHRFARRIADVEKLKGMHRSALSEYDNLFGSLQHRAFHGEL